VITTYAELQTAVGNWLNRSDLTARIPEFVALAEARFRRKIEDLDQRETASIVLTNGVGSLPADFGGFVAVSSSTIGRIEYVSVAQFVDYQSSSGDPIVFTLTDGEIRTLPAASGSVSIVYKQALPSLSNSVTTNWLLDRAPDIYLFGTLVHAEFYGWNDERLPLIKSALDEMLGELTADIERRLYGSSPLFPRIGRT
jgi:hypothetical protein